MKCKFLKHPLPFHLITVPSLALPNNQSTQHHRQPQPKTTVSYPTQNTQKQYTQQQRPFNRLPSSSMFSSIRLMARRTTIPTLTTTTKAAATTVVPSIRSFSSETPTKEESIETKLREIVAATHVSVEDISGGCGSMYKIFVVSPEFEGLALVKQHRLVQKAIAGEIADMHGLTLKTQTEKKFKATKK